MNRKQQIALVIMAAYFIINVQSNIDSFVLNEDEILFRLLDDERIISDPDLSGLDDSTLRVLSRHISSYIKGKTIISAFNSILLVYLFATYLDLYRHTKSSFTLGLVFLSAALLSYSLFTNPVLLGISSSGGEIEIVKYFNFIPDLLTTLSSTILIQVGQVRRFRPFRSSFSGIAAACDEDDGEQDPAPHRRKPKAARSTATPPRLER